MSIPQHIPTPAADGAQPSPLLACEVRFDGDGAWVLPDGELDIATAGELERALTEARAAGAARVTLDLRALTFMDLTGLRLVKEFSALARHEGFAFALVPGAPVVQRVFELTGEDRWLAPGSGVGRMVDDRHARGR